jgi:hypothetical protein
VAGPSGRKLTGTLAQRPAAVNAESIRHYFATDVRGGTMYRLTGRRWLVQRERVPLPRARSVRAPRRRHRPGTARRARSPGRPGREDAPEHDYRVARVAAEHERLDRERLEAVARDDEREARR